MWTKIDFLEQMPFASHYSLLRTTLLMVQVEEVKNVSLAIFFININASITITSLHEPSIPKIVYKICKNVFIQCIRAHFVRKKLQFFSYFLVCSQILSAYIVLILYQVKVHFWNCLCCADIQSRRQVVPLPKNFSLQTVLPIKYSCVNILAALSRCRSMPGFFLYRPFIASTPILFVTVLKELKFQDAIIVLCHLHIESLIHSLDQQAFSIVFAAHLGIFLPRCATRALRSQKKNCFTWSTVVPERPTNI